MTFTTTSAVNPSQLITELEAQTGGNGTLAIQGDPTATGAVLWSSHWTDAQIEAALSAITYAAPQPTAQQTAQAQVVTLAASIPGHITQAQADATTIGGITAGGTLTAAEITALTNHANGWVSILEALQTLVTATGMGG